MAEGNEVTDNVNHPPHYTSSNAVCAKCDHPIECIDVTRHLSFNIGNAMKYLWRANFKNGIEDLRKAQWYINDEIEKQIPRFKISNGSMTPFQEMSICIHGVNNPNFCPVCRMQCPVPMPEGKK
jgi:hypothetical protein